MAPPRAVEAKGRIVDPLSLTALVKMRPRVAACIVELVYDSRNGAVRT